MKLVFVTWWVVSGLGKGVATASLAKLLQSAWLDVGILKIDPYLQVDAGTMSPYEHGEVYVTEDGGETDLDLGNYERFLNIRLKKKNNITTWAIYLTVIQNEREWKYLWQTVQIIPHITDEIKRRIFEVAKEHDITLVEVGGTVGDIESQPFLEALRQIKQDIGRENVFYVHLALLLELPFSGEIKTKPIQHSIIKLREYGIIPDMLIARTSKSMSSKIRDKISLFGDIPTDRIIEGKDVESIYEVPQTFYQQKAGRIILHYFGYKAKPKLTKWKKLVDKIKSPSKQVNILLVGKYTKFKDTYASLLEALVHAGVANDAKVNVIFLESSDIEKNPAILSQIIKEKKIWWVIVPGGFGLRGIEGKIKAVEFVRKNHIPFLGLCLGLQVSVIEFARNVVGLKQAHSAEFDKNSPHKVVDLMEDQKKIKKKGWTMRLGSYEAVLEKGSLVHRIYKKLKVVERHRHRYEVNNKYIPLLEQNGLRISGRSPDRKLVEFIELPNHPFFVATQAHPEFNSSLENPNPLFVSFVKASLKSSVK